MGWGRGLISSSEENDRTLGAGGVERKPSPQRSSVGRKGKKASSAPGGLSVQGGGCIVD